MENSNSNSSPMGAKRILITAYDFYPNTGGVATYAWELAESLSQLGCEVLVLTRDQHQKIPDGLPFQVAKIPLPGSGLLSVPGLTWKMRQWIKKFKPDKVINTLWMPGGVATTLALKSLNQKIDYFVVVHAMEILESQQNWKKRIRRQFRFLKSMTFKGAKKVFCVSEFTKKMVIAETGCQASKCHVVHNGVNIQKFFQQEQLPTKLTEFDTHYPILLTVCRLVRHKGIDQMLYALPAILQKFPDAHYMIGGSGPDENRLRKIVDQHQLHRAVTFLGRVPDESLSHYYSLADLFVLLSREELPNVEGFGLVILEAAACKTPSLGGNSGGVPDAILDGQTGWLVPPNNHQQIAEKALDIFNRPDLLTKVADQAFQHTVDHRTWKHVGHQILNHLYETA